MAENRYRVSIQTYPVEEAEKQAEKLSASIKRAKASRTAWQDKMHKIYRARRGVRREQLWPWKNASNVHLPLIETHIREAKPLFVGLEFMSHPVVMFRGPDLDENRLMEQWYDWYYKVRALGTYPAAMICADNMCEYGVGMRVVGWRHEKRVISERVEFGDFLNPEDMGTLQQIQTRDQLVMFVGSRLGLWLDLDPGDEETVKSVRDAAVALVQGQEFATVQSDTTIHNEGEVVAADPHDCFFPTTTMDAAHAEWFSRRFRLQEHEVYQMGKERDWPKDKIDEFLEKGRKQPQADGSDARITSRDTAQGVSQETKDQPYVLHETNYWEDLDGDGIPDRAAIIHDPDSTIVMERRAFEYPFDRWNVVPYYFETTDGMHYSSRGLGELLFDLQMTLVENINGMFNARDSAGIPMFTFPRGAGFRTQSMRFQPGQGLPVPPGFNIQQLGGNFNPTGHQQIEMGLRGWAEKLSGRHDVGMFTEQRPPERRTAREIDAAMQVMGQTATLDALSWQRSNRDLHFMLKECWARWGDEEAEFTVVGTDIMQRVSRATIAKKYELIPAGSPTNTVMSLRMGHIMNMIQTSMPFVQAGVISPEELRSMLEEAMKMIDPLLAKKIFKMIQSGRMDQLEEQYKEILIIRDKGGFLPQPSGDDDHEAHIMACEAYLQAKGQALDEQEVQMIQAHMDAHREQMRRKRGQQGSTGAGQAAQPG